MAGFPSKEKGNKRGDKAKFPRAGIAFDKNMLLQLIKEEYGNLSRIADRIGSNRNSIRQRCDNDPELGQALIDARERMIDTLEQSCFQDAIENRDTGLRCFLLKTQGRHRGYDQSEAQNTAKDIATAAFDFIISKTKSTT